MFFNQFRQPNYTNFGIPAQTEPGKVGSSADRDMHYKAHSTNKGAAPSFKCNACGKNPLMKSNASIAAEIRRLMRVGGAQNPRCKSCGRKMLATSPTRLGCSAILVWGENTASISREPLAEGRKPTRADIARHRAMWLLPTSILSPPTY